MLAVSGAPRCNSGMILRSAASVSRDALFCATIIGVREGEGSARAGGGPNDARQMARAVTLRNMAIPLKYAPTLLSSLRGRLAFLISQYSLALRHGISVA